MIYNVEYPYEVSPGSTLYLTWYSTTSSYCELYRIVDYGYEQYVTTLFYSGFYQFTDYISSEWSIVEYIIREGPYDYDTRTTGPIYVVTANNPPTTQEV